MQKRMQSFIADALVRATGREWEVSRIEPAESFKLHRLFAIAVPPTRPVEVADYALLSLLVGFPVADYQIFIPEPGIMRTLSVVGELAGPAAGNHVHVVLGRVETALTTPVSGDADEAFPDEASARARLLQIVADLEATRIGPALYLLGQVGKWLRLRRCARNGCSRLRQHPFTPRLIA